MRGPCPYHTGRFTTPVEPVASGGLRLPGTWTEPKHPGDSIMRMDLTKGDEIGDIRVQWYADGNLKVGAFLPGYETSSPGDTPKWWPDKEVWTRGEPEACKREAGRYFVRFLIEALRAGWRVNEGRA